MQDHARRSDWDGVEIQAKALLEYIGARVAPALEERRQATLASVERLTAAGVEFPPSDRSEVEAVRTVTAEQPWPETLGILLRAETAIGTAADAFVQISRDRAVALAAWAGAPPERVEAFSRSAQEALLPAREGRFEEGLRALSQVVASSLPEATAKHDAARKAAEARVALAKEFGVTSQPLEDALRVDQDGGPDRWPETVPGFETAAQQVDGTLRERTGQALTSLRSSLDSLAEYGTDAAEAKTSVDTAIARLPDAPAAEIPTLLADARRAAEEPIVAVVAALLDEVRPRIAEARRLGRDPSEVFAAMNRAREALRLKIYSEALAASQEAAERVEQLTQDLETARDELTSLEEMLERFRRSGFAPEGLEAQLAKARAHLGRAEVEPARQILKEAVRQMGRDALNFFLDRVAQLERVRDYAAERGFLPPDADRALKAAREQVEGGELAEGAERLGQAEVALREAAAPYVARRVQEMEQGFVDIPDEALTAPVRRLLADADVTLRVKGDLIGSVESLRKAERDFAAVFAVHASALVDLLEEERRTLEAMGGAGDEIQRQIDEVQQIFNMGDFVKASRASQEIRTRAQQQQLLRGEEAISHAKLALVELETLGLDLSKFRGELEEAQAAARAGRSAEAHQIAHGLEERAVHTRTETHALLEEIAASQELLGDLRQLGVDPEPFYEPIRQARQALQTMDLGAARATLQSVRERLGSAAAGTETDRLLGEGERLIEDGRRLSAPMEAFAMRLEKLRTERATAPPEATLTATRRLHEELLLLIVPVLEENLRTLERDLDIARGAGVDLDRIVAPLAEARRRVALPVPLGAASLLDAARSEFVGTRGLVEHADRVTKRAREAFAQAELLRVDVGPLRPVLEQVEQAVARREYARAIELGGPLEREILQATYHQVSKTLAGFRATVTSLRNAGGDTTVAENLLHQARMALDEGRPVEAVQLASRSEAELERADLQRRIAEGSIEATERAYARARKDGVIALAAKAELDTARTLFEHHSYPEVLEHALSASDALVAGRESHRRSLDAVSSADAQLAEALALGADTAEAGGRLAQARTQMEQGLYAEALRSAREATEMSRWAIERLFARPIGELRALVEVARKEGLTTEVDPIEAVVTEAEAALRVREWKIVKEAIERARTASRRVFEAVLDTRWTEVESEYARGPAPATAEQTRRAEVGAEVRSLRERGAYADALGRVRAEIEEARHRRRGSIEAGLAELKDRIWVGERLGIDTTPMMQTFSEARVAMDAGRLNEAEALFARANESLEQAIVEPFERRLADLLTEINFASEGLRVSVGGVRGKYDDVVALGAGGRRLEAGRLLLQAEEELALRKSLHRELVNLHYLIDAALARASERRQDTTEARALLAESVRLRETDYAAALEKAREALKRLQGEGTTSAPPARPAPPVEESKPAESAARAEAPPAKSESTPFWPFRRPPK